MNRLGFSPQTDHRPAAPADLRPGWLGMPNPPLVDWTGRRVWIVGASSGIGLATSRALLERGARVYMTARNADALAALALVHPGAVAVPVDACDAQGMADAARRILEDGPLDLAGYFAGHYLPQRATAFNLEEMLRHDQVNYVGALHMLAQVIQPMAACGGGHISLVSSVAGYRGLPNGLAYGPTKAALINLAETLWLDLRGLGIGVSLINPGFVQTPLTARNDFTMPALITPEQAADQIVDGWARGRFELHFPRRFTWWMKALRLLPFGLYQRSVRMATGL